MTSRKTNIKQHYVPQFYLRNFVDENEKFFVYDVNRKNNYPTSPKKECYEKFLYDINPEILNKFSDHPENHEEIVDDNIRVLNEEVSAILLNFLDGTIKSEKGFKFERPEREKLYDFILLQTFRTPFYRERLGYLCVSFALKTALCTLEPYIPFPPYLGKSAGCIFIICFGYIRIIFLGIRHKKPAKTIKSGFSDFRMSITQFVS